MAPKDKTKGGGELVTVISATIQEFQGLRYYLCGKYFQRKGVRLHRQVWMVANQAEIPADHEIHHRDNDRSNNQPENLESKHESLHMSDHGKVVTDRQRAARRGNQPATKAWHQSEAGRAWHSAHARSRRPVSIKRACDRCAREYEAKSSRGRYCGLNCKMADFRDRRRMAA